ncbi:MAG TPA: DUF4190 domain-containing protein [Pyrinomonadaceae bacterium]|nr:DUF4190 domain-containing protein [Pyrinomonadaceae bacterium]
MKYCPVCKKRFDEPWLSFCSDDGTPLIQELTPPADPNWNPHIREPKLKTPDEEATQWLPREPPLPGGWIAPDERPPMKPGPWQPPPPPPAPRPFVPGVKRSEGLALASMITAIAGFVTAGCFGPFPGIVALVLGLIALSQIKKSPEKFGGKPYATAGVIIGAVSILFYGLIFLWIFLRAALR